MAQDTVVRLEDEMVAADAASTAVLVTTILRLDRVWNPPEATVLNSAHVPGYTSFHDGTFLSLDVVVIVQDWHGIFALV